MPKKQKSNFKKKAFRASFVLFISGTFLVFLFYLLVNWGLFGKLPTESELLRVQNHTASEIFSVDEKLLGRYFIQNRTNAELEEVPEHLAQALVATEDARFYEHKGIDGRSTLRVIVKSIIFRNKKAGGGSTITQQLAKNLYPRQSFGILTMPVAKAKEINIAKRLERIYSKEEILELYLNTVPFGENTFGIETAALVYFNKPTSKLNIQESASLIGILKANYRYNPRNNYEAAMTRRNIVLHQMHKYGYLSQTAFDSLSKLPIEVNYQNLRHDEGLAPYFREFLRQEAKQIVEGINREDGSQYNIYTDGLKIYTTINYKMQSFAEKAVESHMAHLQDLFAKEWKGREPWMKDYSMAMKQIRQSKAYINLKKQGLDEGAIIEEMRKPKLTKIFTWKGVQTVQMSSLDSVLHHFAILQSGFLFMDRRTGDVLTWVGGSNYKFFKYDHITSKRQAGSTFKPIVYAHALENGAKPCDYYPNDSIAYPEYDNWVPRNADRTYGGFYSIKGALANSVNTVSVQLLMESGIGNTIELAHQMGIQSELPEVPSLALGTGEVSLFEMVHAYTVFLNKGKTIQPRFIRRIEDQDGNLIYVDPAHAPGENVLSERTSTEVLKMLKGVVENGTASRLHTQYGLDNDLAGKTGTTQQHTDSWFIGLTPNYVAGCWVGGEHPSVRFRSLAHGQGAYAALPIVAKFLNELYAHPRYKSTKAMRFDLPDELDEEFYCLDFKEHRLEDLKERIQHERKSVGKFIKNIFGRKNKKKKQKSE